MDRKAEFIATVTRAFALSRRFKGEVRIQRWRDGYETVLPAADPFNLELKRKICSVTLDRFGEPVYVPPVAKHEESQFLPKGWKPV